MADKTNSPDSERTSNETRRHLPLEGIRENADAIFGGVVRRVDVGPVLDFQVGEKEYEFPLSQEQAARADSLRTLQELMSFLDDLDPGV